MALVAYDNSDASDYEEDEENQTVGTLLKKPEEPSVSPKQTSEIQDSDQDGLSLFNLLPQPSTKKPAVVEEDDEFLHKKEKVDIVKPKAKITVPSLKDFKDVHSPTPAKPKTVSKTSGLLSILPQPRNGLTTTTSKSLTPYVLTQKRNIAAKKKESPSPAKKSKKDLVNDSDDSDNEDDVQNDFFSIHKPVEPIADLPPDIDLENKEKPNNTRRTKLESYFKPDPREEQVELEQQQTDDYEEYSSSEAGSSYSTVNAEGEGTSNGPIEIDEEAIVKLCGSRGKRKKEDIQMVDINQRDLLIDAQELLRRGLMEESTKRVPSGKKKGNEPTSQQKRKHQITYLAHQAKAKEAELKNQWANSRMSRRQTQNKYGF